jgi:hypothetical protein
MIRLLKKLIKKFFFQKTKSNNDFYSFNAHEKKIVDKYGFIKENFFCDYLPEELTQELKNHINNLKPFSKQELIKEFQRYDPLVETTNQKTLEGEVDTILSGYCLDPNDPVIDKLHNYLRNSFKDYLKSPITFVNSKAWTTPNDTKLIASNAMHLDGFEPGHLKFMIYINGLSRAEGEIILDKELITNKKPGFVLLFKNSDVVHAGVPGETGKRLVVEFTIMRTFIDKPQINRSHFVGRHLRSPLIAYYSGNENSNTLLNHNYLDHFS